MLALSAHTASIPAVLQAVGANMFGAGGAPLVSQYLYAQLLSQRLTAMQHMENQAGTVSSSTLIEGVYHTIYTCT